MKSIAKKVLSCLLIIALSFSMLPLTASAEESAATAWTKISLEDISADDTVAVTMTKDNVTYVLPTVGKGSLSQPLGDTGVVSGTTLTTPGASSDYGWSIASAEGGYTLQTGGGYLYIDISENKNNCVRIGDTAAVWTLADSGYLSAPDSNGTTRYLGVYTGAPDWRAYENTTGNTKDQTLGFWVLDPDATPSELPDPTDPSEPEPSEPPVTSDPTGVMADLTTEIGDGSKVYIYNSRNAKVLTATASGNMLAATDGVVTEDQLAVTEDMAELAVSVDADGYYSFQNDAGEYLTAGTASNVLTFEAGPSDYSLWTVEASENGNGFFIKSVNAADDSSNPFGLEYYNGNFTTYKFNAYNGAFLFQFYTTGAGGFTDALAAGDQVVIYNPTSSVGMSSQPLSDDSTLDLAGTELILSADNKLSGYGEEHIWTVDVNEEGKFSFAAPDGRYLSQSSGPHVALVSDPVFWTLSPVDGKTDVFYARGNMGGTLQWDANSLCWSASYSSSEENCGVQFYRVTGTAQPSNVVAAPKADVKSGVVYSGTEISFTCSTEGATILYKVNDSAEWTEYTGPIAITEDSVFTVKATKADMEDSREVSFEYTIYVPPVLGEDQAQLVTDVSQLVSGDQILIVTRDLDYALGTSQKANNRDQATVIKAYDKLSYDEFAQIITLESGIEENTFALYATNGDNTGYLYASPDSGNLLRTQAEKDINASFTITIDEDGSANITSKIDKKANTIRYNTIGIFSCYGEGSQKPVCIYKLDGQERPGLPEENDQVVIFNQAAKGVLSGMTGDISDVYSCSISSASAVIKAGQAECDNGAVIFTVEKSGDYYRFHNESFGYLCSTGTGNNAYYSQEASEDADWVVSEYNGGYRMGSRTATFDGNTQYLQYFSGGFTTWGMYAVTDRDVFTYHFYPCSSDKITDGVVNDPQAVFGNLAPAYAGQRYLLHFTVDALFGVKELTVSLGDTELTYTVSDGRYTATIPAELITGENLVVTVTGLDNKDVAIHSTVEIEVKDEPGISQVSPAANSQTREDKRPEISAVLTNVGENPTVTMAVNDAPVDAVLDGGKLTYKPNADMADGRVTVTVTVTRTDGKSTSKTWSFTVGESDYQLYFGQLHSHNGEYSDGSGTLSGALEYIASLPEEANVDFVAFTDHSNYFDKSGEANPEEALYDLSKATAYSQERWTTYKNTIAEFNVSHSDIIAIPGFEMTWSGGPGHMNTFVTEGIVSRNNTTLNNKTSDAGLRAYYDLLSQPEGADSISQFNHPGTTFGNFTDFSYWSPEADSRIYLVEVGNGEGQIGSSGYYPSYEQYTLALDKGWHLAPTNNQDNHKGKWGNANDARDVVLVEEFTEEGIYDAIRNYRVYSTEDKNLEITYMVNDLPMGTIIETVPDTLNFDITVMDPDDTDSIAKVELIVNSGKVAYTWDAPDELATGILSAQLTPNYSYYYVRVTQADGDLAVTAPVWVGESLMLGISSVGASTSAPVTGEKVAINTQLYNSEDSDALVKSVTYTTNGSQVLWVDNTTYTLPAGETLDLSWDYTPDAAKLTTITVTAVVELESTEYTFSSSVELDVQDASSLTYIGVDASHSNEYVSGYNKDLMGNFTTLANQSAIRVELLTSSEALIAACGDTSKYTAILLNTPSRRLSEAKDYSEAELAALVAFHDAGGTLIITGSGDSNDKAEPHVAATQNRVLEALGSALRLADDGTYDDASFSLSLSAYGENALTDGLTDADLFSYYGGSSIYAVDGDGAAVSVLPDTVSPVLYANSATISKDADSDGLGGDTVKYPYAEGDQRLLVMAMEQQADKGMILVAGAAFMNDFDLKIPAENANNAFCENLFEVLNPTEITPISQVKSQSELGYSYTVEGVVTSNASGYDHETAFFDCIYVQDETGGINLFPVDGNYKLGDVVRVSGITSAYQGEIQLSVSSIEKVGEVQPVAPTAVTAAQINDRSVEGMLVTIKGTVVNITTANDLVESIYVQDSSGAVARVFIDGYITAGKAIENLSTGCTIEATGLASYDDTYAVAYDNYARIRVRDRGEITCTASSYEPVYCSHTQTEIRNAKEATCTEDGYTGDTYCKFCGARIAKGSVIPATGHNYVNGVCTVCGDMLVTAYADLDTGAWYYEHVAYVTEAGLMQGVGGRAFAPDMTMTRAQMVTILYRYLDVDESELEGLDNPFTDLKDDWYRDAAVYLAHIGVVNGTSDTTFSPDAVITREEMMTMLYRMSGVKTESDGSNLDVFADGGEVSSFAVEAMDWAVENGLVNGLGDGTLAPQGLSTRAQAAKVIHCFILLEDAE